LTSKNKELHGSKREKEILFWGDAPPVGGTILPVPVRRMFLKKQI